MIDCIPYYFNFTTTTPLEHQDAEAESLATAQKLQQRNKALTRHFISIH